MGKVGWVVRTPNDVDTIMNEWLNVRHALAHGHAELPLVSVLEVVRGHPANWQGQATLRRDDASSCVAFFKRLVAVTAAAAASEFGASVPSWS